MVNKSFEFKIGVIGLGYVGTPLACLFSKKYDTWGYDIKAGKVYSADEVDAALAKEFDI